MASSDDPHNLQRFVDAQALEFEQVCVELRAGQKRSHWMWFIFPQLRGLGRSSTAQLFGIGSLAEARAYLAHPELAPRLIACVQTVLGLNGGSLHAVFGSPDDVKFCSSMTLFGVVSGHPIFDQALLVYCNGARDQATLDILQAMDHARR